MFVVDFGFNHNSLCELLFNVLNIHVIGEKKNYLCVPDIQYVVWPVLPDLCNSPINK